MYSQGLADRQASRVLSLLMVAGSFALVGCGGSDDPTGPGTTETSFVGAFGAGSTESGVINVSAVPSATGSLALVGGGTVSLTGSYSTGGALSLSGTGYTFTGSVSGGKMSGTYTGPDGPGRFAALPEPEGQTVLVFCGTYDGDSFGVWNLVRSGNTLFGLYSDDGGDSGALSGGISGSALTAVNVTTPGGSATGALSSATDMDGEWAVNGDTGFWQGSTTQC